MYSVVACTPSVSGSLDVGPASHRRDAKAQYGAYRPPNPRHAPQNGLLPARALRPLPVRRGLRILRVRPAAGPGGRAASSGSGCVWGVVEKGRSPHPSRHPPCSPTPRRSGDTHGFCSVCYKAQQSTALAAATAPSPSPAPAAAAAAEPAPAPAAEPMLVEPAPAAVQEEAAASPAAAQPAAAAADASEAGDEKPVQVRFGRDSKQLRLCRVWGSTFLGAHSHQQAAGEGFHHDGMPVQTPCCR